ncbi:adenosylcobinamide-phosphate synthase CbiB [Stomatohabitans albus]|uniref:adenosylcobinamide-phosphate synthase CbiB n=1 Tax=Stomatohabitans albus TaxID=3110766 RepID=UPI00300C467B
MGTPPSPLPVLLGAITLDQIIGEPPVSVHPVVAIGWVADQVERIIMRPDEPLPLPVLRGGLGWIAGLSVCTTAGYMVAKAPRAVQAIALWTLFSHKMLVDEVSAVEEALDDDVQAGRDRVAMLVSRDTSALTPAQVRGAAIESLAENLSDSVTAPLFWWAIGGMPAASAYRWINTADARFGYRDSRWEYLGKVAARMDDLANVIPARLTGLILAQGWRLIAKARPDISATPSPNAGWPMAVMAHYLDARLEKVGVYTLNASGHEPAQGDIRKAVKRVQLGGAMIGVVTGALAYWRSRACR